MISDTEDTLRPMESQDIDRLGEIWLAASLTAHDFVSADFWRSQLETMTRELLPRAEGYVHVHGDRIDGFVAVDGDFIHCLFVEPKHQRQGVGTALLSYLKGSRHTLCLHVYQQNQDAIGFYKSNGFVITGEASCPHTGCAEFEMEWRKQPDSAHPKMTVDGGLNASIDPSGS